MPGPAIALATTALVSTGHLVVLMTIAFMLVLGLRSAAWAGLHRVPKRSAAVRPARLLAAAGCAAGLFALLAFAVMHAAAVTSLDEGISNLLAPYRASWLLAAFMWLTTLGTGAALAGMVVVATGFLWLDPRRAKLILPLWTAFTGAQASVWISKFAFDRARPVFLDGGATAASPSFPSAHMTGAVATLGFIAYVMARDAPDRGDRFEIAFWTLTLVALIGFSRVFLGVHFASDVAGGVLIGGAWLLAGVALTQSREPSSAQPDCVHGERLRRPRGR